MTNEAIGQKHKILMVDDEAEFLDLMRKLLSDAGYEVVSAVNGLDAVERLKDNGPYSAILADYKMPVMQGTDFLQIAREIFPHSPRIMITAYQTTEMMGESINKAEVFRFLVKPVNVEEVLFVVESAVEKYEAHLWQVREAEKRAELVRQIAKARETVPFIKGKKVSEKARFEKSAGHDAGALTVDMFDMLSALSTALDIINPVLNDHHQRTCYIASCLADELKLPDRERIEIFIASILHDIGAIILSDRFQLLDFEDIHPHGHAELGAILLESFPPFAGFSALVRFHHVPWSNGEGGVFEGHAVPPGSHVIHLADRIAVLVKKEIPIHGQISSIRGEIASASGRTFNPQFVEAFSRLAEHEAFWLDLVVSNSLDVALRGKSPLPYISLNLTGIEELTRFFSTIIDTRSHFTANHSSGVAACAEELARLQGMTPVEQQEMRIAGYLHDFGKLAVPETILEKPGKLDEQERQIMKAHTYHTYSILKRVEGLEKIALWASLHHETLKGDGYPFHYTGDSLPLGARILAVADVFTALTENRPYRNGMTREKAQEVFSRMVAEEHIDGDIVEVLLKNFEDISHIRTVAQKGQGEDLSEFWKVSGKVIAEFDKH